MYLDGVFVGHVDIDGEVLEVLGEGAPGSLHRHHSSLHAGLQTLGNLHQLERVDFLHFNFWKRLV